ncbi:MAG: hypothetical protein ABW186_08655, partial [Rhodanobacteraceae bacterium]
MRRNFWLIVLSAAWLAPSAASAQFMRPGTSPESGFAGVWRIVGAKPAPWAASGSRAATATPLLEYAIEIAEGEVKGPAAIACGDAHFSSGVSARDELFDGRFRDHPGAAEAFALTSGSVTTFRVICDGKPRDWY